MCHEMRKVENHCLRQWVWDPAHRLSVRTVHPVPVTLHIALGSITAAAGALGPESGPLISAQLLLPLVLARAGPQPPELAIPSQHCSFCLLAWKPCCSISFTYLGTFAESPQKFGGSLRTSAPKHPSTLIITMEPSHLDSLTLEGIPSPLQSHP